MTNDEIQLNMGIVILDGKPVQASEINPELHKFVGTFRYPKKPKKDNTFIDLWDLWQNGYYDKPQYVTIESEELKVKSENIFQKYDVNHFFSISRINGRIIGHIWRKYSSVYCDNENRDISLILNIEDYNEIIKLRPELEIKTK